MVASDISGAPQPTSDALPLRTWQKAQLPDEVVLASISDSAPHLSRGFKIEDVADTEIPRIFSYAALSHAISGSIGGNVAMSGRPPHTYLVAKV